jgi:hypothetical protein
MLLGRDGHPSLPVTCGMVAMWSQSWANGARSEVWRGVARLKGAQSRTWPLNCWFAPHCSSTLSPLSAPRRPSSVLSKLAYLTLCRSIQLLALLTRGDAAEDLEILVCCATSLACCAARSHVPNSGPATVPCSPRSAGCYPGPVGRASSSGQRRSCAGTGGSWPTRGPTRTADQGDRQLVRSCSS